MTPDWDIQPQGVQDVVDRTVEAAEGIQDWGTNYSTHLQDASAHAGTLAMAGEPAPEAGLVGAALAEFAEATQTDIQYVVARASDSLRGTSAATMAYLEGDLEMAERAQQAALQPPDLTPDQDRPAGGGQQQAV